MALAGSGTEEDPWLIQTGAEWASVLRNQYGGGFYRATGNLSATLSGLDGNTARLYVAKVIDAAGYELAITLSSSVTVSCVVAGVHFFNAMLRITAYVNGQYSGTTMFANCFFTDCALLLYSSGTSTKTFGNYYSEHSDLLGKIFTRLLVLGLNGGVSQFTSISAGQSLVTFFDVYQRAGAGTWYSGFSGTTTVALLDATSSGAFTSNGWFDDSSITVPRPYFADVIGLIVNTLVGGAPVARDLMYEAGGKSFVLGRTDETGVLDISFRVRRFLTFRIIATESYAIERLQEGSYVVAGVYYLPPVDNGYKYLASNSRQVLNLGSISFGAEPVDMNGATMTPVPVYPEMVTHRTSRFSGGPQQLFVLDTADLGGGGGGPVLEGDPAFLDGVVEEIHPMLGTVRPLVNAEVVVFERRGSVWASMGSAFSNLYGEFRVDTEVYGGGDIFAFAADLPGLVWQPVVELGVGAKIRPTVNNGYVYEVITPGNSGATEPTWWADTGDGTEGAIGGATAKARPYYQPVGHGPLKMTFVE